MEEEEIDSIYSNEINKANESFLNGLKEKKNIALLEIQYKEKLRKAREKYSKLIARYIRHKTEKKNKTILQEKKEEKDKSKIKVQLFRKIVTRLRIYSFRLKIFLKRIKERLMPKSVSYGYKKSKANLRRVVRNALNAKERMAESSSRFFSWFVEKIKTTFQKTFSFLSGIKNKVLRSIRPALKFSRSDSRKKDEDKGKKVELV